MPATLVLALGQPFLQRWRPDERLRGYNSQAGRGPTRERGTGKGTNSARHQLPCNPHRKETRCSEMLNVQNARLRSPRPLPPLRVLQPMFSVSSATESSEPLGQPKCVRAGRGLCSTVQFSPRESTDFNLGTPETSNCLKDRELVHRELLCGHGEGRGLAIARIFLLKDKSFL